MNILHISDIHFGRDRCGIPEAFENRNVILSNLVLTLSELDNNLKPDVVFITGDIAWRGKASEFQEAYEWFQNLQSALGLDSDRFVFCPGNHDLNRNVGIDFNEEDLLCEDGQTGIDVEKCDYYYSYEQAHLLEARFYDYNLFCEKMGMQPYSYQLADGTTEYSYLIGGSRFQFGRQSYQIVCFNTAYLPYGKALNDDQMFLGLPQLKSLLQNGVLEKNDNTYRIALFHHADRFLYSGEQCSYNQREAPLTLLMKNIDLALCGHTETGSVPEFRHYEGGGRILSGGAAYYNDHHRNSFSIVNVKPGKKPLKYSFYCNGETWLPFEGQDKINCQNNHYPIQWEDSIHARKKYGIALRIDEKMKVFYYGHVEAYDRIESGITKTYLSNRFNPARPIDYTYSVTRISEQYGCNGSSHLQHGPSIRNTITARKAMSDYNTFVAENIAHARTAEFGVVDLEKGLKFAFSSPVDISRTKAQAENYSPNADFYDTLSRIEEAYDVRFYLPERHVTESEQLAISILEIIRANGYAIITTSNIIDFAIFLSTREEFKWINSIAENGLKLNLRFNIRLKICIFGTIIDLGNCDYYYLDARTLDKEETLRKMTTWEEGDRRSVHLVFENDTANCCIVPLEMSQAKSELPFSMERVLSFPSEAVPDFSDLEKEIFVNY